MLNINVTLLIQAALFLMFLWVLTKFLFKPVLNVLNERLEKTEGLKKKAIEIEEVVGRKGKEYDDRFKDARANSLEVKSELKREGVEEEKKIIQAVRKETKDIIEEKKGGIYKDVEEIKSDIEKQMGEISSILAEKVLGRRIE